MPGQRARIIECGVTYMNIPISLKGKLSQTAAALCDIIQIHQYCSTCNLHKHPSLLCTFDGYLSTCTGTKFVKKFLLFNKNINQETNF
ncbi:hypothetical protein Hanom_Chr03g00251451 [Helianthus anomalus]